MSKICDLHVHSDLSVDSKASIETQCLSAISKGIPCIAFTEHYDVHPKDEACRYLKAERFAQEIVAARQKFAGQLRIFKGLEFGEPYLFPDELAVLRAQDYDVILGSVHWVGDLSVCSGQEILKHWTIKEVYERYYTVILESVKIGGFDVLAHFDLPKRYLHVKMTDFPVIDDILHVLVQAEIALEINTSSIRKGLGEPMPNKEVLEKYAELGGRRITVGSDAHKPEHIGADFESVQELLREFPQFEVGYFDQRRFVSTMSKP
jgi:histidinol-phosphatase (PHP family)